MPECHRLPRVSGDPTVAGEGSFQIVLLGHDDKVDHVTPAAKAIGHTRRQVFQHMVELRLVCIGRMQLSRGEMRITLDPGCHFRVFECNGVSSAREQKQGRGRQEQQSRNSHAG